MSLYLELFFSFCYIGLLTYGGGYSALPLIEETAVIEKGWMTAAELADMISISEISPGPFSLNCSTFVGMKMAGWPGAAVATAGFLFLPAVIVFILTFVYKKFSRNSQFREVFNVLNTCVVAILLMSAQHLFMNTITAYGSDIDWIALIIFAAAFLMLFKFRVNPIYVILASGLAGLIMYALFPVANQAVVH